MKFRIAFVIVFFLCFLKISAQIKRTYKNLSDTDLKVGNVILAPVIYFSLGSCAFLPQSLDSVKVIATFIKSHPAFKIEIGAHTDVRGNQKANVVLSKCRAQSIVDYLTKELGFPIENITAKGYGSSEPLISDSSIKKVENKKEKDRSEVEDLHAKNRRVEIKILKTE